MSMQKKTVLDKEEQPLPGFSNIREKAKSLWLKSMEAVGNTAANIASNTKYKVDEVTLQNRRRVVMNDLAGKTYSLWLKGTHFPDELSKMLNELQQLDDQLNDMRAAKYAASGRTERTDDLSASSDTAANDEPQEPVMIETSFPVGEEINDLFDHSDTVGKMAQKVNTSLDQMSDRIRSFPAENHADAEKQRQE